MHIHQLEMVLTLILRPHPPVCTVYCSVRYFESCCNFQNTHVAIGTTAVATTADYFVPAGTTATFALTSGSSPIAGISTGSSTTIDLPEHWNPFVVDDVLTITGVTGVTGFNTTGKVVSVDSANTYGYFERLTIDYDGLDSADASFTDAKARKL